MSRLGEWVTNAPREYERGLFEGTQAPAGMYAYSCSTVEYLQWRSQFVEGPPKATETFTVEELERGGMVGLYRKVEPDA